ncbi:uncharacterized protein BYT42DRAFT_395095 [Radiomyces spectabilis]|uniref:uncharacterized protein n=1 Tax=Radiomyces spectabilis TaxID=64574 RepID=UPI00221E4572|nr:uncharacterized protein BYT42DRAFT_395095 [Radiomyces spectabilis]KAI8374211.1 hypothetical protein BYT42DRAFT_395095 [Radiomyces spectabilis]
MALVSKLNSTATFSNTVFENLQETTRQVLQAKVPDHSVRIELVPIEWHRHIHEQVDPIMNQITLKSIPTIRLIENDYLADVLYYFSKDRGQNIVDNITNLYNTSYHNFLEKHPNFNGKIAILGYSLGGVITWDILSHQRQPSGPDEEAAYSRLDVNFGKLDFKPDFFFGLGSPISAVLTFRNQSPKYYHPDFDIVMENLFHPFDPLAYRFEPLFNDYFTEQSAVLVKRAVPIGPSFSFPSMPSLPGIGFLSLFSWKFSSNPVAEPTGAALSNATAAAAEGAQEAQRGLNKSNQKKNEKEGSTIQTSSSNTSIHSAPQQEQGSIMSSVSNFLQYFTRGRSAQDQPPLQDGENTAVDNNIGIITWDPLREQTREQLLALRDDLDRTLNANMDKFVPSTHDFSRGIPIDNRPQLPSRSKTYAVSQDLHQDDLYSFSYPKSGEDQLRERSVDDTLLSGKRPVTPHRSVSTHARHHLVEVLGIDGVRMESLERARANFGQWGSKSDASVPEISIASPVPMDDDSAASHAESKEARDGANEADTSSTGGEADSALKESNTKAERRQDKKEEEASGSDNIWANLNQEIHEPGPAVMSPGVSKADVARDATRGKRSSKTEAEEQGKTEEEKEMDEKIQLQQLPGGRRMDYVLQPESFMSMIANEYLVGLRAHFSYWTNKDLLWHILGRLEVLETEQSKDSSSERNSTTSPPRSRNPSETSSTTSNVKTTFSSGQQPQSSTSSIQSGKHSVTSSVGRDW